MVQDTSIGGAGRDFPETDWSRILAGRGTTGARRALLEDLFAAYWKPLYHHARRRGLDIEAAKDAVQGLLVDLLEREEFLERLDPEKGRLRAFLRVSLDRWLGRLRDRRRARKRGGGARTLSLDAEVPAEDVAAPPGADLEAAYERDWALAVLSRATRALERDFAAGRFRGPFEVVLRFLGAEAAPSYAEAALACGKTVPQFKVFLHRARARFRKVLADEVARTVADARDAGAELERLRLALARPT